MGKGDNRRPTDEARYGAQHERALGVARVVTCSRCGGVQWRFVRGEWLCGGCGANRDGITRH